MELNVEEIVDSCTDADFLRSKAQKENEMRKQLKFCDLTLKINDKDLFQVHKNIIASSCPFFTGLFNGDWKETRQDVISLDYKISPECFEIILEYLYTGKLGFTNISLENAKVIHEGAVYFESRTLKKIMSRILEEFVTDENLLELWRHGVMFFDDYLRDKCLNRISENSVKFFENHLLKLTFQELESFYKTFNDSEEKERWSDEDRYEYAIKWIKADFDGRAEFSKVFLNYFNFSKMSGEFIQTNILKDEILYKNEELLRKIMGELSNVSSVKLCMIKETKFKCILLISNTGIFKIDLITKKCLPLLKHEIKPKSFAVNKFGLNNILISGGLNSNICEYYCPNSNTIKKFAPMLEQRRSHGILEFNNKIYAFGGCNNDTMEIYDINSRKWSYGPKMPCSRWKFALSVYGDDISLLKGISSDGDTYDHKFNTKTLNWTCTSQLLEASSIKCSVVTKGFIYCFSDFWIRKYTLENNEYTLQEIYYYKNKENYTLSSCSAAEINNVIFIFGKKIDSEEIYSALLDPETETLIPIQIDLSQCGDVGNEFHLTTALL